MSLHSNDSKREEYHRYLEKSGVIEYFSHVLVDLYETPERPLDPNEYLREQLSKFFPDDTDDLRQEIMHHEDMIYERENALHELQQQQYELRLALEAKGIKFEDLNLNDDGFDDDDDDDDDVDSLTAQETGDADDDDDRAEFNFSENNVPVFKYHHTTDEELVQTTDGTLTAAAAAATAAIVEDAAEGGESPVDKLASPDNKTEDK